MTTSIRFGHIELPISDPQRALSFYRDALGCEIEAIQGERFIWIKLFGVSVLLNPQLTPAATDHNLVLYAAKVESVVEDLRERGVSFQHIHNCWCFSDPDGNRFQLVDPGDDHSGG